MLQPHVNVKLSMFSFMLDGWSTDEKAAASLGGLARETISTFGSERCMFGSNYPVDKHMGTPASNMFAQFRNWTQDFPAAAQRNLFHDTAAKFYRIARIIAK